MTGQEIVLSLKLAVGLLKWLPKAIAVWLGYRRGRMVERMRQNEADLKDLRSALRARRAVKHDAASVQNDPYNRD